jgi:aryl-alcohol dehydrogenase-like predicted oxidoreductase
MQFDTIDLYYAHYDDPEVPIADTVAAFDQLVTDGLVLEIGLSNYTADRVTAWLDAAAAGGHRPPVALQPHYNLVHRSVEAELLPIARARGMAIVPYFGLASGFLTGKYRTAEEAMASHRARFLEPYLTDRGFAVVDAVVDVARANGVSAPTVALAWVRAQPGVLAPIASASGPEQLEGLLEGVRFELSSDDLARLTDVSAPR